MKVVIDTNVVISGTFWTGNSYEVIKTVVEGKATLIVSVPILEEYDKILNSEEILDKTTAYQKARIEVIHKILSRAVIVEPKEKFEIIKDDLDDNKFLDAAIEGSVNYIISQDKKHLLILKKFHNIPIISPEEFLKKSRISNELIKINTFHF